MPETRIPNKRTHGGIVINALQYKQKNSGIGIMIRQLFGSFATVSAHSCTVVLSQDSPEFPVGSSKTVIFRLHYKKKQNLQRLWFQSFGLGRLCRNAVLLTTDSKIPFLLPKSCILIPVITDLAVFRMPEVYQKSRVFLWKTQYQLLKKRVSKFVAISACTKADLTEFLGIPESKISIVPCAADRNLSRISDRGILSSVREKYALPERYILFVGNFNPRKNLERLIAAFDLLKKSSDFPHKLVIAGEHGWKFSRNSAIAGIKNSDQIIFLGYVPDEGMAALYTMAELFIFPSLYEGFGIPIIEAQQCGVPVITSDTSALPDTGGDGAMYVNPYDVSAMADAMKAVLTDEAVARDLRERGYINAKRFSWEASALKLKKIIEEVIEE